jgi:2,3-bisphosphoglycerate-dependent phosphoglycerate mutase
VRGALNEKDYGVFTGKNKQQVRREVGDEGFQRIRRSWGFRPEGGESLEDVHARIIPLHYEKILPLLLAFHKDQINILAVSHNNTLRAYIKELEDIPEDQVSDIELGTAEIRIYDFDPEGRIYDKTVHAIGEVH